MRPDMRYLLQIARALGAQVCGSAFSYSREGMVNEERGRSWWMDYVAVVRSADG